MTIVRMAHISMQSTDSAYQQRQDAIRVFARATIRDYAWVTGTEANTTANSLIYQHEAQDADYRYVRGGDCWIAVKESRIASGFKAQWNQVVKGKAHQFPNRGVLRVTFTDVELGEVTVLASHFQTKRTSKRRPADNKRLADKVGAEARAHGAGDGIVFYGADTNITDRTGDTFKGEPLTSCWDELKKWPGTGHDNIDVIASYDADKNVTCTGARVLDDSDIQLFTDHFLIEAVYAVSPKPRPKPKPNPDVPHVGRKFVPPKRPVIGGVPRKHSGTDNKDGGINRIVVHSAVIQGKPGAADQLGRMNATSTTGSWHYATDSEHAVQCSWDSYVCWHAPPNKHSLGVEMADWPKPWPSGSQTKAWWTKLTKSWRWRTPYHSKMLRVTAELVAELCLEHDVPIQFLSVKMLKNGQRGITIHANVSKAFKQSTHWDPGAWPRIRFMRMVRSHAKQCQQS